jgi:hypothetical protein
MLFYRPKQDFGECFVEKSAVFVMSVQVIWEGFPTRKVEGVGFTKDEEVKVEDTR